MKLKSLTVALGILSPLALISSSYVPSTNPQANDLLRQANEARRARQGNGANVMTIARLNQEEKQREQQQQQQANNANQQAQAQQQAAMMGQQAAQANLQAAQAEQLAQLQAQVQRQEDERRRQAEELASLKVALELQRQENERAGQRPFSGNQQENKEQEQKQNPRASSSNSRPAAPAPGSRKEQVKNSLRAVNSAVDNAGSGAINYGRQAIGLANDNMQSINQQIDASAQKGDDLLGEFEQFLQEEVAPVANGAINIADRILNMNRYWNPGKDDRPKNNTNRRANNNNNRRPQAPADAFKKQGL